MIILKNKRLLVTAGLMSVLMAVSTAANAIPAFARKYQTTCNTCHTAYPKLNATGRNFKEQGYAMSRDDVKGMEKISDYLNWDEYIPLSGAIVLRPYDHESSGNSELRVLHEVEILSGGRAYKDVATWFEIEAEDDEDEFNMALRSGFVTYVYNQALNFQGGYGGMLFADPYDTYADMRRLTASHNPITNLRFGEADNGGRFRDSRQQVSLYGRVLKDKFFYILGYGGLASDTVADKSRSYYGRLAFDIMPDIEIGGIAISGSCEVGTDNNGGAGCGAGVKDRDFTRYGIDTQMDINDLRITGTYVNATDDVDGAASGDESNAAWYLAGIYSMHKSGRTTWVPLLRLDGYEENDGKDSYSSATVNIGYYFTQNIKGFIEYSNVYDAPTGADEISRSTVQFEAAF